MANKVVCFAVALAATLLTTNERLAAQDVFTLKKRASVEGSYRYGDVSPGAVIRTDERYNRNGLFQGPRGWAYWNYLPDPKPYQNPNLWPDQRPTYFFGQLVMPAGSSSRE